VFKFFKNNYKTIYDDSRMGSNNWTETPIAEQVHPDTSRGSLWGTLWGLVFAVIILLYLCYLLHSSEVW
jgi:hypothetical protein